VSGDTHDFRVVNDFAKDTTWLHGLARLFANDGVAGLAVGGVVALGLQALARPLATLLERLRAGRLIAG
jgi:hypothetical protein